MMKYLLIQTRQLGDILLTTPCIREIKRHSPGAHVAFFCHEMGRPLLSTHPDLDELHTYSDEDSFASKIKLAIEIHRRKYDVTIDFMNNLRSGLYTFASTSKTRVSYKTSRSCFYNRFVLKDNVERYVVDEKFRFLKEVGVEAEDPNLFFPSPPRIAESLERELCDDVVTKVVLSPTHRRMVRRWPLAKWVKLSRRIEDQSNSRVIWIWGPGEDKTIRNILQMGGAGTMAPKTDLLELAALIKHCDLFVGNSNGPSHIAVAMETPSLQLHGPTSAISWCPLDNKHRAVVSPNGRMEGISVDSVWDKVKQIVNHA